MKIAVVIIHGMGSQTGGFSHALQRGIAEHYASLNKHWDDLYFQEVLWADILSPEQSLLYNRLNKNTRLDFQPLRHFFVNYLGDVIAYQGGRVDLEQDQDAYRYKVHQRLDKALNSFHQFEGFDCDKTPLVMIGHSLGTVIMFNHLWHMQYVRNGHPFETGRTLAGFMTLGSPLALWTLRQKNFGRPFEFPGDALDDSMKQRARWLNLYDKDDVIAYPLKPVNEAFAKVVIEDIPVNVGGILDSWNPLSHSAYWEDKTVHQYIAKFLANLSIQKSD